MVEPPPSPSSCDDEFDYGSRDGNGQTDGRVCWELTATYVVDNVDLSRSHVVIHKIIPLLVTLSAPLYSMSFQSSLEIVSHCRKWRNAMLYLFK